MGTLYLVATPIGNLEDISLRALRILREVPLIATEDTRRTRLLLQRYEITTPLTSYYEHNKLSKLEYLLGIVETHDIALVSEAGMPGISDPGYELVRTAIERGITVVPIPGASAVLAGLAASGLPTDQFVYLGFLPRKSGERRRRLASVASHPRTIVAFESPHRLLATLSDIFAELGDRPVAVGREMTKLFEEFVRGPVSAVRGHFGEHPPRGEFTIIIAGAPKGRSGDRKSQLDDFGTGVRD
jgi:16S rRNA (cytidine1402-2'-O)-methyltransferase